ncbi:MAG: hypothetical protein K2V38_27450, partial [Gemmataceae bacterium]|nr:hypothetical protein [Gemmataceae bacterium]
MLFDLSKVTAHQTYNLLNGLVAPRPISWITSIDLAGRINAAPFSAYTHVLKFYLHISQEEQLRRFKER